MANTSAPDSGYTPVNLPTALTEMKSANVRTDVQGLADRFGAHTHTVDTTIPAAAVTSSKISLTYAQVAESTGALTNTSWADIGTGITVTTPVANCVVWINFFGKCVIVTPAQPYVTDIAVSLSVGGVAKESSFSWEESKQGLDLSTQYYIGMGFSVPVVVATAGATVIKLRAIKSLGTSYNISGILSAFVVGP